MTIPPGMRYAPFRVRNAWIDSQPDPRRARWVLLLGTLPLDERPKASGVDGPLPDSMSLAMAKYLGGQRGIGGRASVRDEASPSWDTSVREMEDAISLIDADIFFG